MAILKLLPPWAWVAAGVATAGAVAILLGALGFRWDPLGLQHRRMVAAEARAAAAEGQAQAEAAARRLETEAAGDQLRRLDDFQQQQTAATRATATAVAQARTADDAETPLESRRADRLRGHDRELCRLAPDLDGCAAPAEPAADGDAVLRPGGAAG
jgi:hypothetical protein